MFSAAQSAAFARALQPLLRLVKALENRRAARALLHLDARGLKDIGLNHAMVLGALDVPLTQDPTLHLSRITARRESALEVGERSDTGAAPEPDKGRYLLLPSREQLACA